MKKKPIVFKVPPNSKLKVTFFGPCNEVITNVSIINQLLTPKCQTITQYPNFKKYVTEVRSLSHC
ncbi:MULTISPECIES: hypothetical protein [Bacillus]|uniref:Uncharacterized protein n=1 Tax=Bacillus toyonensis TaxID=155322 RepID=A0AB73R760_9BACI|nr:MULTISPECIES: hypothetical protein [Bacillus]EJR61844.1 hypothetical protein IIO_02752 [Bacillus cereus VD115]EOP26335.1 hypothetical protein IIS_01491 [Bacillus cereus VD131]OFD03081.1 hypothetical protein BTGOE5_15390 [Bacillus thuringiensis]OTW85219.1 hypothetical protein BK702_17300 [Bacillus thuringiensis serovar cameroun]OTX01206.1 hypothetical protein BK712_26985 [Bacillus thuringiensis serovar seoulensis]